VVTCDLTHPSPLALEVLSARPYAYLDDAPLEERRTQAVMGRRWLAPETAADLGRLDTDAIARVRTEAWPDPANAEELHDALLWLGCLSADEAQAETEWNGWLTALARENRVTRFQTPQSVLWVAAERLAQFHALWPETRCLPSIAPPQDHTQRVWSREEALAEIVRGRLEGTGPLTQAALATPLGLEPDEIGAALTALEVEGFAMRGCFSPGANVEEWCDRRLLARIHHYTVRRLRAEIEPVAVHDFWRFLFAWQHMTEDTRLEGPDAVPTVVTSLEGFEAPAGAWETEIFPARIAGYEPSWLDDQCLAGRIAWTRLSPTASRGNGHERVATPVRTTPITLLPRRHASFWTSLSGPADDVRPRAGARAVLNYLRTHGASFFDELVEATGCAHCWYRPIVASRSPGPQDGGAS
jgi:ATP-dependent Lhr-like helicase